MKKIITLIAILCIISCSNDGTNFALHLAPIEEAEVPESFTYRSLDTISISYKLPNTSYALYDVVYTYQDTTRIVAVELIEDLEQNSQNDTIVERITIPIRVTQRENYLFKFYKGKDSIGTNIFEEIEVPVIE